MSVDQEQSYQSICRKLEQHEETITQLLAILAVNNRKLNEINQRQISLERHVLYSSSSPHTTFAEARPPLSTNTSHSNK
ncbi:hypothetical protein [Aquibacillus kalidii]|uniref:hypothetical protein n=1 Tax=Aquibacillus kalidii TaxID=2762597 RepID=UPI0016496AF1|nr:hypothetical protein [Aquibacillus kalidii]